MNFRPIKDARIDFERRYIAAVIKASGCNITKAAGVLGISRVSLHRRMRELGITRDAIRERMNP